MVLEISVMQLKHQKGEEERALAIMKKIYTWNNKGAKADDYPIDHLILSSREDNLLLTGDRRWTCYPYELCKTISQLFKHPLTRSSIALLIIIFSLSFGYYGLFMWFPELFKRVEYGGSACSYFNESAVTNSTEPPSDRIYVDGFYTALSNLPGNLLTIVLMDRLSRKFLLTSSMIVSGISVFFIWFQAKKQEPKYSSCLACLAPSQSLHGTLLWWLMWSSIQQAVGVQH